LVGDAELLMFVRKEEEEVKDFPGDGGDFIRVLGCR
jgi:hypothetical protein